MGYISHIADENLGFVTFPKPVSVSTWTEFCNKDFGSVSVMFSMEEQTNYGLNERGEGTEVVVGFTICSEDSSKAYDFDDDIALFQRTLYEAFGTALSGSFKLMGEENEDIVLYTLREDGTALRHEATITFGPGKILA